MKIKFESSSMAFRCERCGHAITPAELAMGTLGPDPTLWIVWTWVFADLENEVVIRAPFHFICRVQWMECSDLMRLGGA